MSQAATRKGNPSYYYRSEGQEAGPVSGEELLVLFETHMITAYDEVRGDGEASWQPVQQIITSILESKKAGGRGRGRAAMVDRADEDSADRPRATEWKKAREEHVFVAQRGAPTPKPEGSISDEELAHSIAYANTQVKRGWMFRGALTLLSLIAAVGLGLRYSANLHAATMPIDMPIRVEMRITIENASAVMDAARGTFRGTGSFALTRVRDITWGSDGSVAMTSIDESSRLRADLEGSPDHNELKPGGLRGRSVTFTATDEGWQAALDGSAPSAKQALKLEALAFDNGALYPDRRLWPWPWQSWVITAPEACSLFALDLEGCKSTVRVKFAGFAACGAARCARLTFEGEWDGDSDGDQVRLQLSGEILRSLAQPIDVSVQASGDMTVHRAIAGPTSSNRVSLVGSVLYEQTAFLADEAQ